MTRILIASAVCYVGWRAADAFAQTVWTGSPLTFLYLGVTVAAVLIVTAVLTGLPDGR